MLSIQLPESGEYRTAQNVNLDGIGYTIRINWNDRAQAWYIDLSDENGAIVSGRKLLCNWPILLRDVGRRGPLGQLMLYCTGPVADEAGLDLSAYRLLYWTAEEVAAL